MLAVACDTDTAGISAVPVAFTPAGGWTETPSPVLATCTEPLVAGAPDMRRTWVIVDRFDNDELPIEPAEVDHMRRFFHRWANELDPTPDA